MSSYTDEYLEYEKLVRNSDGVELARYRGEETRECYYFTAAQVENYVVEVNG